MDYIGDEGQAHLILHLLHSPFHYTSRNYHLGQGFASFTLLSCRRWRSSSPAPQPPAQQPLAALVTSPDKPKSKITKIKWQYFWMELQEMKERSTPPLSPAQFLQSFLLWLPEFSAYSTIELKCIHATNIVKASLQGWGAKQKMIVRWRRGSPAPPSPAQTLGKWINFPEEWLIT